MLLKTALLSLLLAGQAGEIEKLIAQLGSESVEAREKAQAELEKRGTAALPALKRAVASSDAEISAKARELVVRIRGGRLVRAPVAKVADPLSRFGRADHFHVSPDEKLAVGSDLHSLSIWTIPDGALVRRLTPHPRDLRGIILSPDGTRLLTVGNSYTEMAIWEFPSLRLIRRVDSSQRRPVAIAPAPGGLHVAVGAADEVLWVRAETGKVVWRWSANGLYTVRDVDVSPDGKRVAVVGANSSKINILDASSGRVISQFSVHSTGHSSRVHFSTDSKRIVITNPDHAQAWLFEPSGGKPIQTGKGQEAYALTGRKARFVIRRKAGGDVPEGKTLIVSERYHPFAGAAVPTPDDRTLIVQGGIWKPLSRFDLKDGKKLGEIGKRVTAFSVSEKGVLVGEASGRVVLYDLDGKELGAYTHGKEEIRLVAFAGGDRVISVGRDNVLRCRDLSAKRELWGKGYLTFNYHVHQFAPDNRHVFSRLTGGGSKQAILARWSVETGVEVKRYEKFAGYIAGIGVSPDGRTVAASGRDGPTAAWDVETGKKLWEYRPGKNARWLAFTPDSKSLVAGDDEGRLARFAARTGKEEKVYVPAGGRILRGDISGDGQLLAASGDGFRLTVFHLESGEVYRRFGSRAYDGIAFLDKTEELISSGPVTLSSLKTGKTLFVAGRKPVKAARLDGSGKRLATLVYYSTFIVTDLYTGRTPIYVRVPTNAVDFVLGPGARSAVLLNSRKYPIAHVTGNTVTKIPPKQIKVLGANSARGVLYSREGGRLQARDMGSLNILKEADSHDIAWISSPHGSEYIYASVSGKIIRLHHERLDGATAIDLPPGLKDLDVGSDGLFMSGLGIFNPQGGAFGRIEAKIPGKVLRSRFSPDGEGILVLTQDGKVVTLRPGR